MEQTKLQRPDERQLIDDLPKLVDLQQVDLRIGELLELRAELDDGTAKEAQLTSARARLDQVSGQLSELRGRQVDRRLERDSLLERRDKNQKRLWEGMPDQKEAEALQRDLQSTAARLDQIQIDLSDLENRIEPLEDAAEDEQRTVSELEAELEEVRNRFVEEVKDIDSELASLRDARQAQTAEINGELLRRYETIRTRRGDPGVVEVSEDVCTACSTQLTNYMLRRLQLKRQVEHCENCNTMLYWSGESNPRLWMDELRDHPDAAELFEDED